MLRFFSLIQKGKSLAPNYKTIFSLTKFSKPNGNTKKIKNCPFSNSLLSFETCYGVHVFRIIFPDSVIDINEFNLIELEAI